MSTVDRQIPQATTSLILKNRKELQHLPEHGTTYLYRDVKEDISRSTFWKALDHGIIKEVDKVRVSTTNADLILWETADWLHAKYARFF